MDPLKLVSLFQRWTSCGAFRAAVPPEVGCGGEPHGPGLSDRRRRLRRGAVECSSGLVVVNLERSNNPRWGKIINLRSFEIFYDIIF